MAPGLLREELRRAAPGLPSAFTIGTFDGVHRGHQFLIRLLRERAAARGLASGAIALHPHPLTVVRPGTQVTYITSLEERLDLLRRLGLDIVAPVSFTSDVSQVSAEEFLRLMVDELQLRFLLVGPDSGFGRGREGSGEHLAEIGGREGVEVEFAPTESEDGHKIGASDVRAALESGDVERVNFLLGRRYSVHGPVVYGDQRGRTIDFPTANLAMAPDRAFLAFGVYVACAYVNEGTYVAAVNIGSRPTFGVNTPTIEAHLLDFSGDLYGRELRLEFVRRLRGELKFSGLDELRANIAKDVAATRQFADCGGI